MNENKSGKDKDDIRVFCMCKNSCQRKTGPKRAGCPCKDKGLKCNNECQCGKNIVCKNRERDTDIKKDVVDSADNLKGNDSETDLKTKFSNMHIIDEPDDYFSDETDSSSKEPLTNIGSISIDASVKPSSTHEGQCESMLSRVQKINSGYALVIHNESFKDLPQREGSEKDEEAIKIFCEKAGLTIDIQKNLTVNEIKNYCRKLTQDGNIFEKYDGLVCFILSHGNRSGICGVHSETIDVQEIVTYFKENEELLGKPKLFFIQACRADGLVQDDNAEEDDKTRLCPPESSDILIAHSTIEGEFAYRHIRKGSWFIQTLINKLTAHAKSSHLMDIMTAVNEDIAGSELEGFRQMPMQVSTLTKFVYFNMATVVEVMYKKSNEKDKLSFL